MNLNEAKEFLKVNLADFGSDIRKAEIAERYYLCENDILFAEKNTGDGTEPLRSADNRIPSSFYPLLVNQKAAYTFTDPPIFSTGSIHADKAVKNVLGNEFAKKCKSLCVKASNCGYAWVHYWQDKNGAFRYAVIDGQGAVGVFSDGLEEELNAVIRVYQKYKDGDIYNIYEIWDSKYCTVFCCNANSDIQFGLKEYPVFGKNSGRTNVYMHCFGKPPFIMFRNNEKKTTDLECVKSLIDIYDKTYSGFANDLEDIQEVIMILSGYSGTDITEFLTDLKKYKVIKLDDISDRPGVDTLSIEIPVEAREKMLEMTRKSIFEEGQGVDPRQSDFGNSSGVALQFMYSLLELKAGLLETEFRCGFDELCKAICRYYGLKVESIDQVWTRTSVRNDKELSEIAVESKGIISDKTIISRHPWVENPLEEEKMLRAEA